MAPLARTLLAAAAACVLPAGAAELAAPFARAALWASELQDLVACDYGLDDATCPGQPEHGGSGFLSAVFAWRYSLNNLRASLVAAAVAGSELPEGLAAATLQVLGGLDMLMERPVPEAFLEVVRAARSLLQEARPFLLAQPAAALRLPPRSAGPAHWVWPSDGRTPLSQAAFALRTGARMPAVGFGTWRLWGKEAYQPVRWALQVGYRHIDTAEGYANEGEIGQAIRDSGVPREELFLATKASSVPKGLNDVASVQDIFAMQLQLLGTEYVDVYMLHTPPQDRAQLREVWMALEVLWDLGRARALGISNCDVNDLRFVLQIARVPPAYIQNLFKVYKPGDQMPMDEDIVTLAHSQQIVVVGYSVQTAWPHVLPPLEDPHVLSVAAQVGRTPSQVLHRWALQRGIGVIPKSGSLERITENARLFDFELGEAAMRLLDGLATLSESAAERPRPAQHEDVFNLGLLALPRVAEPERVAPADLGPPELLARTRDQGFAFAVVRDHLLGPGADLTPGQCRESCLAEPRCAAWEVCAPYDPRGGCDGCYLIGLATAPPISINGWYAAVERGVAR